MARTDVGTHVRAVEGEERAPAEPPRLRYRPGLDGLRAVAVLAVMVQHAGLRLPGGHEDALPGGFLGVDVFFVISGFLITSLLLAEHRGRHRIDLRGFWLRRARRLLPAVGLAIAATCILVAVADLPVDARSVRGDALASLGYVANWRFIFTRQSYFAAFGLPSPFRHLWSLSVEEQWYLLFPPALALGLALGLRRRPGLLVGGLVVAAVASATRMAMLYHDGDDPSRIYFGTDTRAYTLLIGAVLATVATFWPRAIARVRPALAVLAVGGLAVLAFAFRSVDGREAGLYQGGLAVVALASAAVVAGVALPRSAGPVHWVLSRRVLVAIGLISYGLYLWHWPIFVWLTPDEVGIAGWPLQVLRFGLTFAVAGLSYTLVERPIRRHGWAGVRGRLARVGLPAARPALLTAGAGAVVVATVVGVTGGAGPAPSLAIRGTPTAAAPTTIPIDIPITTVSVPAGHPLPALPPDRPVRMVIGGDSVAWSLGYGVAMPPGIAVRTEANLGCTAMPGQPITDKGLQTGLCKDWQREWQRGAVAQQADVVVGLWGAWEVYDHRLGDTVLRAGTTTAAVAYRRSLVAGIEATVAARPDVRFVFLTIPCMDERGNSLGGHDSPRNNRTLLEWVNRQTRAVAAFYGGRTMVVDLGPLLCPHGDVLDVIDGVEVREDGVHFSPDSAPIVWDYVARRVRPWLALPAVSSPR
jgi:peptidoglycan/LPS O-acetylase OafA/YrhL